MMNNVLHIILVVVLLVISRKEKGVQEIVKSYKDIS